MPRKIKRAWFSWAKSASSIGEHCGRQHSDLTAIGRKGRSRPPFSLFLSRQASFSPSAGK
ncbi:MAG: hypothetical protein BAA03_00915 [Caldibacillus debilis]|nr:MAG: hypothetical protein BAA03_00915 [Caldibacillus debilis]